MVIPFVIFGGNVLKTTSFKMLNELEQKLYDISVHEIENHEWGVTQQYLDVMKVATENGKPKLERIEYSDKNSIKFHFDIEDENFFFTTYFENEELVGIEITNGSIITFSVISKNLNLSEILAKTSLNPTRTWQKGDKMKILKRLETNNGFVFEPITSFAGDFEAKLLFLLKNLEPHKEEILDLKQQCWISIDASIYQYIHNSMLGGFTIEKEMIRILHHLNLEVSFQFFIGGEPFEDGAE
jgi:hypothetical protein